MDRPSLWARPAHEGLIVMVMLIAQVQELASYYVWLGMRPAHGLDRGRPEM